MCGLIGFATSKYEIETSSPLVNARRRRLFNVGLLYMEMRGSDSTGVAMCGSDGVDIYKRAICASRFLELPGYQKFIKANSPIMIGHTRQATTGKVNKRNAHPFLVGNVVGAHNGMVSNYLTLKDKDDDIKVDSEVIFKLLDGCDDVSDVFAKVQGSAALAWYDMDDPEACYLVRHNNPLHLVYVSELGTWYWISEAEVFEYAVRAFDYHISQQFELHKDEVYRINTADNQITKEAVKFKQYKAVRNKGKIRNKGKMYGGKFHFAPSPGTEEKKKSDVPQYKDIRWGGKSDVWIGAEIDDSELSMLWMVQFGSGCSECGELLDLPNGFYFDDVTRDVYCRDCVGRHGVWTPNTLYISYDEYCAVQNMRQVDYYALLDHFGRLD